jgi:hypothetical protein
MAKVLEPLNMEKRMVQFLEKASFEVNKVGIVFFHGLGDCVQFMDIYDKLVNSFPKIKIDIMLQAGLEHDWIFPNAVMLTTLDNLEELDYDYIFKVHMPVEQDPTCTKGELCCRKEIGFDGYVTEYGKVRLPKIKSPLVGVHFHNTALPSVFNVPENVAEKIWNEIIEAGYIPIELAFKHPYHNPINTQFNFINCTVRDTKACMKNLVGLINKCHAVLAVPSGPLHCALSIKPDQVMYLEREVPIERFTHHPVASVNVDEYVDGTVKHWVENLHWILGPDMSGAKKNEEADIKNTV